MSDGFSLLNNVPCGIFSFTNNGIINYANNALLQQLGYTSGQLNGRNVEEILTLSSRIFFQTHFLPMLTLQGEVSEIFLTLKAKDNEAVPVLINAASKSYESETHNVCACITVHQRKKYEDEILEAKKTAEEALHKNELLKQIQHELEAGKQELDKQLTKYKYTSRELLQLNEIVTHDLQEPLRKISIYVDAIERSKVNAYDDKTFKSFSIINKSVSRIRTLLQSLQDYLPILTKPIEKSSVHLTALIEAEVSALRLQHTGLPFEVSIEKLPIINADVKQLKILFHQLLGNCIEFRNPQQLLHIKVACSLVEENVYYSTEGKYKYVEFAQISIEDNGLGFNAMYKDHIFKMLKRLDYNRKGLGFGLAFCKRIVENHLGFIKASAEEGRGAKFIVSLPVA